MLVTPLSFPLTVDGVITVKGTTTPDCDSFSINMGTGTDFNEDIALHFNPRFSQEEVVRNTLSGGWGEEETDGGFPFTRDSAYEITIVVKEGHYQVSVNGSPFCDYAHRLPIASVMNIFVTGDTRAHVSYSQTVFPLPFPLTDGVDIIVKFVVKTEPHRFSINLSSGTDFNVDTLLHFNPRFDQNEVVRNHFQGGWGEEETGGIMPFAPGAPYEARFAVKDNYTEVYVNGQHFCTYNHRIDKNSVRNVFIQGDIETANVEFINRTPIFNPSVPFCTPIKGGLAPGSKLDITGRPTSNPERFNVNLVCGPDGESNDLALHFDVRINFGDTPNYTVRTHRQGGGYGEEERGESFFPFVADVDFNMKIVAEYECFQIYVNEQYFSTFNYRIKPVQNVDHIFIDGDVNIYQVRFE